MKLPIRIAILASGNGSNAENIAHYFASNTQILVDSFYTNKADAFVVERANRMNIPCYYFSNADFKDGSAIAATLQERNIDFVVLAGFLLKIPTTILNAYPNKIINIHPALLPLFGGKGMYGEKVHQAVKASGAKQSGISIHFVNEHYDEGAIIFQTKCPIDANDSIEGIAHKVHELEYKHFPKIIEQVVIEAL